MSAFVDDDPGGTGLEGPLYRSFDVLGHEKRASIVGRRLPWLSSCDRQCLIYLPYPLIRIPPRKLNGRQGSPDGGSRMVHLTNSLPYFYGE